MNAIKPRNVEEGGGRGSCGGRGRSGRGEFIGSRGREGCLDEELLENNIRLLLLTTIITIIPVHYLHQHYLLVWILDYDIQLPL